MNSALARLALAGTVALAAGCGSLGKATMSPDRSGYSDAIGNSWKEQMLLNLVKIKFADVPVFLDVSSVIASYTFESRGGGSLSWDTLNAREEGLSLGGMYQDRPTITYVPLTGDKFTKALLTPIPPATIFSMVQAGWPVAGVFGVAVRSVNGVRNRNLGMNPGPADAQWQELVTCWTAVQNSGVVDLRIQRTEKGDAVMIVLGTPREPSDVARSQRIREILGVEPGVREFSLAFGTLPSRPGEIAVLSRSLFEIFLEVAATVEVDEADVAAGRVMPLTESGAEPVVAIHSSAWPPTGASVAAKYRGRWYYVRDDDFRSNVRLMFLFFIQAMLESGGKPGAAPTLTIST